MPSEMWKFWIDVGGTFTDVVAVRPSGEVITHKVLSSGRLKGRAAAGSAADRLVDPRKAAVPEGFFEGYTLALTDDAGSVVGQTAVKRFEATTGTFALTDPLPGLAEGSGYELFSGEAAPIVAIRQLMGLRLDADIGEIEVRLGTTRGTNALLERKGASTAFVTTKGFGDILLIGSQERPELFALNIQKPESLFTEVLEMDERIDSSGEVLSPLDPDSAKKGLEELKAKGIRSVAVCLLNSYRNDTHEKRVGETARELGFERVSVSTEVTPLIKMVPRGDTTVVDAYLTPVLRAYIDAIHDRIPQARLHLLTSAGGLSDPKIFSGKDSILSGPAGGVVGFSRVAQAAGFDRAIGFDMGGTSTDVSRFDGQYEYQFETQKAGVRIVAPMLAIETVAAGGGSICAFDGQKLVVGPESAGADPGPACYGRGGPVAVTDLNVFLGRIPSATFPFPLDLKALESRLQEIRQRVLEATGKGLSLEALAEGFLRIANGHMAAAIKSISIAKGYDVREYCLVCFGGAGGQHACAIARMLGIPRVLLHPHAGVLSAYGMGLADVKKFREHTVLKPCDTETIKALNEVFDREAQALNEELCSEGIPEHGIMPPRRMLELRYAGQSATITVADEDLESDQASGSGEVYARAFERKHEKLYGHTHADRQVEVVAARLEASGRLTDADEAACKATETVPRRPEAKETTHVIFEGDRLVTGLYKREDLRPGDVLEGPAIIIERTSTLVVDPGWEALVTERQDIIFTDRKAEASEEGLHEDVSTEVDPIQLEIFNNLFANIAEQMGHVLQRTALSTNVKERLDFSCAVFTTNGELVANAPHIPVHLGALSECVKEVIRSVADLKPGDVVITNDPYKGGSHLPDVTVVTPVFDEDGKRLFFTASRAHHAEIGGTRPGSMPPDAIHLVEEGVVIRPFKLVEDGTFREGALRKLLTESPYPSRAPDENLADIRAQIAANQSGATDLMRMIDRYGRDVVLAYMNHIRDAAERKMRAALVKVPDGEHAFSDQMDDGTTVAVTISVKGDRAEIDFAGTGPVMKGSLNANPAIVSSAVLYVLRCLIDEDIPLNSGVLAPVRIRIPEGFLNPPSSEDPAECPAVAGGNVETSQRVVDVLLGALQVCAASQGTMNNFLFGDDSFAYFETICGGVGAGPDYDGADAVHSHMTNTRLTDPEILETRYPVRLRRFQIRKGSGGKGLRKGGDGIVREVEFLKPMEVSVLTSRRTCKPYGLAGGESGASGANRICRAGSSSDQELPWLGQTSVDAGDVVTILTPGGGGYGKRENE